ncbi:fasciclin domain-containing protein [Novosphingobium sp. Leaf2]|uniref:fasciclin domain-containing protein n=1 Tax=Novosphingobium sp. Leaf2 TaxID=1735670 RepID=UPI0006FBBCB2|nr:fasciclin [Novosphingobium sp. Leaf2]
MKTLSRTFAVALMTTALFAGGTAAQAKNPMVGGAAMYPTKDIVDNAVNSKDHTTLVAAVKAAGLVDTLKGPGPFTVFAPTNEAFKKLPAGTVDTLLKPENKDQLTKILTYHVVPGRLTAADIAANAKAHGGKAELTTVEGETLTAWKDKAGGWWLTDAKGGKARITIPNVMQSNGVIHVINAVLMP